jgi:hypothetical protein
MKPDDASPPACIEHADDHPGARRGSTGLIAKARKIGGLLLRSLSGADRQGGADVRARRTRPELHGDLAEILWLGRGR